MVGAKRSRGWGCGALLVAFVLGASSALVVVFVLVPSALSTRGVTVTVTSSTRTFVGSPDSSSSGPPPASTSGSGASQPRAPGAPPRFSAGDPGYAEPGETCESLADVADLSAAYQPGALRAAAEGLARRRYPDGVAFIQAQDDKMLAAWFEGAAPSFQGMGERFDTAVHEGSHVWVAKHFDPRTVSYPVRGDLTIRTRRLKNFDRSEIMSLRAAGGADDSYATTYLTGASGAQGFNTLLDEYDAYTHSLASRYCTRDLVQPNARVSARDGILAMMYYVALYLRLAREQHAADYAAIVGDPGHRRLILTVWSRAELWLRRSEPFDALGIRDAELEQLAYADDSLAELARMREADTRDAGP
jgi:hypothetical protein